ncbi:hypothetical protein REPUB_Repub20aG0056300 [Reevesia pubescens]
MSKPNHLENLIIAKCKSGSLKPDEALGFFNFMILVRPLPSIWAFNHLLGTLSKMKHYSTVVFMCKQLMGYKDIQADITTMTTLINCLCYLKHVNLGFSVLAMILKLGLHPDSYTINACKEKKTEEAITMLELMIQRNIKPDNVSYNSLIHGLCNSGQWVEATRLFSRMMNEGVHPNVRTFNSLIKALCKEKRTGEAMAILELMVQRDLKPNIVTYNSLMHGLCNSGQWAEATSLLSKMVDEDIVLDVVTFNILLAAISKQGMMTKVHEVFKVME